MKKFSWSSQTFPVITAPKEPTGLWLGEATEFVEEVTKQDFQLTMLVPKELCPLDPRV